MKRDIAVAATKVKKRIYPAARKLDDSAPPEVEASRFGLGILLYGGVLVGAGGLICLISGLIQSGGPLAFLRSWLAALIGH